MNITKISRKAPIQEVTIDKVKGTYNAYKMELSWGQLEAIRDALALHHADPLADELFEELSWYMAGNVPLPGEDKSEKEKSEEKEEERANAEDNAEAALDLPDVPDEAFDDGGGDDEPSAPPSGESGDDAAAPEPAAESADDILSAPPLTEKRGQSEWFKSKFGKKKPDAGAAPEVAKPNKGQNASAVAGAPGKVTGSKK